MADEPATTTPAPQTGDEQVIADPSALAAIDALKQESNARVDEANRRAELAERGRRDAEQRAAQFHQVASTNQATAEEAMLTAVQSNMDASDREIEGLKAQYKQAFTDADADKLADLQIKIGDATARRNQFAGEKIQIEANRAARPQQQPQQQQPQQFDREAYLARNFEPGEAAFVRRNWDRWNGDATYRNYVAAAHGEAMARGMVRDSPEHLRYVEQRSNEMAGHGDPQVRKEGGNTTAGGAPAATADSPKSSAAQLVEPSPAPGRRRAPTAAPVSRDGPITNLSGKPPGTQHITKEMIDNASWMFPKTDWNPKGGIPAETYAEGVTETDEKGEWMRGNPFKR